MRVGCGVRAVPTIRDHFHPRRAAHSGYMVKAITHMSPVAAARVRRGPAAANATHLLVPLLEAVSLVARRAAVSHEPLYGIDSSP